MTDYGLDRPVASLAFLAGSGEMAARTRDFDWSRTPLGPVAQWPQSLKTVVRIMLDSRYAMWLGWGPELIFFYNDAYAQMTLGPKHPWALGRPAREVWSEIWHVIGPRAASVVRTGEATWDEGLLLFLERSGFREETYHTFSYSPVPDDRGQIGGMLCVVTEDTKRTIGERRLRTLRELAVATAEVAASVKVACRTALQVLTNNPHDLPFVMLYLLEEHQPRATLIGQIGLKIPQDQLPEQVPLADDSLWPFHTVTETLQPAVIDLPSRLRPPGAEPGAEPRGTDDVRRVLVLPLARPGLSRPAGFLVTGLSPVQPWTDEYRGFVELLAGQIASAIANARAYAQERERAAALAELDQAKTAFFSNVSHEFRTPLTLMLGPIDDLLDQPAEQLSPAVREQLETVNRNGLRLLRLVNTLLDFSRIEAGRVQARFEATDLSALTADLVSNFRSACERAGLELKFESVPVPEPVFVDRGMWEKIVLNLLSNAFKFTLAGGIHVTIQPMTGAAVLTISDTGIGIPAGEMNKLFERFHRVENAGGRTHEGSGIGLALVQELVRLHHGSITAQSELGRGTTFRIMIPTGKDHLPADRIQTSAEAGFGAISATSFVEEALRWLPEEAPAAGRNQSTSPSYAPSPGRDGQSVPQSQPGPSSRGPGSVASGHRQAREGATIEGRTFERGRSTARTRILVADDNADMRQYIARLLRDQYDVECVSDGAEALQAVERNRPNLILSDVMMPRMNGFELLAALRQDPKTATIPIIMLSARAGEESRVEGMQAGVDDYLVKPFSSRELLARVSGHLQLARVRQEASETLRRNEEQLREIISQSAAGIAQTDLQGRFILCNQKFCELIGCTAEELHSRSYPELIWEADRDRTLVLLDQAISDQQSIVVEHRLKRADGTAIWVRNSISLVHPAEETLALLIVSIDLTDRKQAEEALLEADRRKDEFLATLAHELRNPLAPIRNGLQILKLLGTDRLTAEEVRLMMERQLNQMVHLVDDLLDLSRISRNKIELRKEQIDLTRVIQLAVETSRPPLERAGHRLTLHLPPQPILVDGDLTRLVQVFSNLLNNACKYSDAAGEITLSIERADDQAIVQIRDSGIGIPPDMLDRVFEMFTQIDRNLERTQGGLGIGLSIVKRLVEMHGGSVDAHSDGLGRGSLFTVRLPALSPAAAPCAQQESERPKLSAQQRILVVDDNPDSVQTLSLMLRLMGHATETAFDGVQAVEQTLAFQPDVILLDLGMPRMNGYDAARQIRELPSGKTILLIALTGWGQEEDRRRTKEAGFDHHLTKPVESAQLMQLLSQPRAGQR